MKQQVSAISDGLVKVSRDFKIWFRVLILLLVFIAGAIMFSRERAKPADCGSCERERGELLNALIDIRKDLTTVSRSPERASLMFSSFVTMDTTKPKQPPPVEKVVSKIDSLLLKYKQQKSKG